MLCWRLCKLRFCLAGSTRCSQIDGSCSAASEILGEAKGEGREIVHARAICQGQQAALTEVRLIHSSPLQQPHNVIHVD